MICKRCTHEWKPRNQNNVSICPRCKSKKWDQEKIRAWDKNGSIYVILLKNGSLSVGRTTQGDRRIKNYGPNICYYISPPTQHSLEDEKKLIKKANEICHHPIKGRETFKGDYKNYLSLVSFIKSISENNTPHEQDSIDSFDILKFSCLSSIEKNIKWIVANKQTVVSEREQFYLSVKEAVEDYKNGICTSDKALLSLSNLIGKMLESSRNELANTTVEKLIEKFNCDINDISSQ